MAYVFSTMVLILLALPFPQNALAKGTMVRVNVEFDATGGRLFGAETVFCNDSDVELRKRGGEILLVRHEDCKDGFEIPLEVKVDPTRRSIALLEQWLHIPVGLSRYELEVTAPRGWVPVSEADRVEKDALAAGRVAYRFVFDHPRHDVTLILGRYEVNSSTKDGVEVATYFFRGHRDLSREYIEKAHAFIRDLSSRIGPFPFKRFSIVENEDPTGYGMATMTLIGTHILAYPFIVEQSLGHEIAHSWFGNGIYVKEGGGNWCEGLTTYVADYFFKEKKGEGTAYRHDLLIDYQSYVHSQNTLSLRRFRSRQNRLEKAVGYGKGAMVFHMLRRLVGDKVFTRGLRSFSAQYLFKDASWDDIQHVFEGVSNRRLATFFDQWVNRPDCPRLAVESPSVTRDLKGRYKVAFDVVQYNQAPYELLVPYELSTECNSTSGTLEIRTSRKHVEVTVDSLPLSISIDPGFDVMRVLSPGEFPPTISRLLGSREATLVMCRQLDVGSVMDLIGDNFEFTRNIGRLREGFDKTSLVFLGCIPEAFKGLLGGVFDTWDGKGAQFIVRENPLNNKEVIGLLRFESEADAYALLSKVKHYGRYNYLAYERGRIVKKEKAQAEAGITKALKVETMGIASKDLYSLTKIIDEILDKDVIFVGEEHDQYAHHLAQLDVIKGLHERGVRLSVGMEMFQRPFQGALDDYIQGRITEEEFLRESEYFDRWGYDYVLYRPILKYCRENKIPVVALNIRKEISRKVARHGLDSLTHEEKALIPKELDFSNELYKRRLREVFEAHQEQELGSFEYFYQAQVLWDETMAQTVARYMADHPGAKMVVLAGIGHVGFGYGIPSRVKRRTGASVVTIASTTDVSDPGLADYFLFPPYKPKPFSARLGVLLDVSPGRPITVKKVMPGSAASMAGIRAGDQILGFDGHPVKGIVDLKIGLISKGPGDNCTLTIKRNRRFLPDVTKTIKVGPFGGHHGVMMVHGRFHGR